MFRKPNISILIKIFNMCFKKFSFIAFTICMQQCGVALGSICATGAFAQALGLNSPPPKKQECVNENSYCARVTEKAVDPEWQDGSTIELVYGFCYEGESIFTCEDINTIRESYNSEVSLQQLNSFFADQFIIENLSFHSCNFSLCTSFHCNVVMNSSTTTSPITTAADEEVETTSTSTARNGLTNQLSTSEEPTTGDTMFTETTTYSSTENAGTVPITPPGQVITTSPTATVHTTGKPIAIPDNNDKDGDNGSAMGSFTKYNIIFAISFLTMVMLYK